jgi:hypothetical protein
MSWDLDVVPHEHASDPNEWLERLVGTPGDTEAARAHAAAVLATRPELEASEPDEDGAIELGPSEESGLPLQVFLDGRHASLNVPYWDLGDRTDALGDLVEDVVRAIVDHTGWVPFDPQEGGVVELDEVRENFLARLEEGVGIIGEIVAKEEKPQKRRFFGLFGR